MVPYPKELRTRVVAAVEQGDLPLAEIAPLFGVGRTFVKKMLRLQRAGEDLTPRHGGGPEPQLQEPDRALRRAEIAKQPEATLAELHPVRAEHGRSRVRVAPSCRALLQLQLPRKKKSLRPGTGRKARSAVSPPAARLCSPVLHLSGRKGLSCGADPTVGPRGPGQAGARVGAGRPGRHWVDPRGPGPAGVPDWLERAGRA
jgi:transposase